MKLPSYKQLAQAKLFEAKAQGKLNEPMSIDETIKWMTSETGKTFPEIIDLVKAANADELSQEDKNSLDNLVRDREFKEMISQTNENLQKTKYGPSPSPPIDKHPTPLSLDDSRDEEIVRNINRMKKDLGYENQTGLYAVQQTLQTAMEATESLEELMDRIEKLVGRVTDPSLVDGSVKRVEQFLITLLTLSQQTTYAGIFGVIITYVSTLCDRSFTKIVMDEVKRMLPTGDSAYEHQAGWFSKNWMALTEGPLGSVMGKIISLLIAVGFLPAKATSNMGRGIFELFKVKRFSDDGSSFPLIMDCITSTIDWVIEMAWPAAITGNFRLLLQGEKMLDLDEEYRKIVDCCDLYLGASYDLLKKKHGLGDSGFEIIAMIDESINNHMVMKKDPELTSSQKAEISRRLLSLDKFSNGIQSVFKESTIRVRPYTFLLRGGSGVNKTGLNSILIHVISEANGFPQGDQYHCHFNEADQYMSDFMAKHFSATFDDIGNPKPEREQINPLFKIIQFINNMHCTAMSAEAHLKGKKDINVKIVSATTNTSDLHAGYFSCNPASIMSRFNMIIDVCLKEDAINEKGKIKDEFIGQTNPDMWNITAHWVKVDRIDAIKDSYTLIPYSDVKDLPDLMEFIAEDSKSWFAKQDRLVGAAKAVHKEPHCDQHPLFTLPCLRCGNRVVPTEWADRLNSDEFEEEALQGTSQEPPRIIEGELFEDTHSDFDPDNPPPNFGQRQFVSDMIIQDCLAQTYHEVPSLYNVVKEKILAMQETVKKTDPTYVVMATAASVLGLCLVASTFYKTLEHQASIEDVNAIAMPPEMVAKRDNAYKKVIRLKAQYPEASMTATQQQFVDKMDSSLMLVKVRTVLDATCAVSPEFQCVASWPVGDGRWLLPHHIFNVKSPTGQFRLEFIWSQDLTHKRFTEIVELEDIQRIAGSDIACVRLFRGGCNYSFTKFLQEDESKLPVGTALQILPKTIDMVKEDVLPSEKRIMARITGYSTVTVKSSTYYAVEYTTDVPTFKGLCGAPVVTVGENPMIIGFHTAGKPADTAGVAAVLIRSDLHTEYQGILLSERAPCPTEQLGTPFTTVPHCKYKSPVHWLEKTSDVSLEYHGQHNLPTTRFKSKVAPSILVDKLETVGIKKEHAGPLHTAETMARQDHLLNCSELLPPPNPKFLKLAAADMKSKLKVAMEASDEIKKFVHPLSYSDALNGVPGVPGYDPIAPNTAPGFGRTGPKWKLCIQDAIDQKLGGGCPRLLTQKEMPDGTWTEVCEYQFDDEKLDVKAKVAELFEHFSEKVRSNVILKCNLKDEALPLAKVLQGKLRVFSGASMDFVIATRMIFSPLNVLMTHLPTLFESAVGVNAQGKDWDFIGKYLKQHGSDRVFGGDFAKYDQRMRSDFTITAMEILKDVMRNAGFPENLIDVVDGIACEICFPFYEINGVFVQVDGSNPSGHPLTVILNGIVNCLLMRYCYYAMHHKAGSTNLPLFHEVVALMTYGDDNVAGVSKKEKLFNHLSVAKELALLGMKYTMPDKTAEATEFIVFPELDFLKRKFRVHEDTGTMIGALDIKSIYKSLTTTMKAKGREQTEVEVMAGNIANALSELWAHGPAVFNEHKAKFECLKEVKDGAFTINEFWRDITAEDCLDRYNKTTCAYEECIKKFNIPYEYQSLVYDDDCDFDPYFGDPEYLFDVSSVRLDLDNPDMDSHRGLIRYTLSQDECTPNQEAGDILVSLEALTTWSDWRMRIRKPWPNELMFYLCQFKKRQRQRKRLALEVEAAVSALRTHTVITRRRYSVIWRRKCLVFQRPIRIFWRLMMRRKFAYLPSEVSDMIKELATPYFGMSRIWKDPTGNYFSFNLC